MVADLEAVAPSAIMVIFILWGVVALVRHEMAPKRGSASSAKGGTGEEES
jgi:hypothetical protein